MPSHWRDEPSHLSVLPRHSLISVGEQSTICAGDGGFQVAVQGKTTLIGGAITSTQEAVEQERNRRRQPVPDQSGRQAVHQGKTMSMYEDDVRSALKAMFDVGELLDVGDAVTVFDSLSTAFPTSGSKIDWEHVPGSIEFAEPDVDLQHQHFVDFFDEMQRRFGLPGPVTYVGDSATDFALTGAVDVIRRALPVLLEVPQHHYLLGPGCSWCMCLTMEGDIGFGRSESTKRH